VHRVFVLDGDGLVVAIGLDDVDPQRAVGRGAGEENPARVMLATQEREMPFAGLLLLGVGDGRQIGVAEQQVPDNVSPRCLISGVFAPGY